MSNVYCTLVMLSDEYVPGALVLAHSLRESGSLYPIWCMVDVSVSGDAVAALKLKFDRVIEVPIIQHDVIEMKSYKQRQLYGAWISKSFTKWWILNPNIFAAEKVIFIDADVQILKNIDNLFDLPAPAATFSSPWAKPYVPDRGIYNPYGDMKHGEIVPMYKIKRGLTSIVGIASVVLVKPSKKIWEIYQAILGRDRRYGHPKCVSGFDEQVLAEILLQMGDPVYHIHPKFNLYVGKIDWMTYGDKDAKPYLYHFYNTKPWNQQRDLWDETIIWWGAVDEIIGRHPELAIWFKLWQKIN